MTDERGNIPHDPWIIDVHQHFVPDFYRTALTEAGVDKHAIPPWVRWDRQSALDFMDNAKIKKSYLSITDPGVNFGNNAASRKLSREVNEAAAALAQQHPDRFGGFASLPLPDVDGAIAEIEYALDTLHMDGVVLMSSLCDGTYLGDAKYDAIFDELQRRKSVVYVHPVTPLTSRDLPLSSPMAAAEYVFDTTRAILNLVWSGTAHRCPDIKFIFSHAGGTLPYISWRCSSVIDNIPAKEKNYPLGAMTYFKRFSYDLALSSSPGAISSLKELVPATQILFGSDFPYAPAPMPSVNTEMFSETKLFDAQDRIVIGRENPLALFGA